MIHKKAHVQASTLGDGCFVWQFASVIRGAVLGNNVTVASCAIVDGARVGDNCIIGHGASVHPGVLLEADVFVGPGAVLCNDSWPRTHKRGWHVPDTPMVIVRRGASIGANATVLPGVIIGEGAMVAAGIEVRADVPAGHKLDARGLERIGVEANKERVRMPKVKAR